MQSRSLTHGPEGFAAHSRVSTMAGWRCFRVRLQLSVFGPTMSSFHDLDGPLFGRLFTPSLIALQTEQAVPRIFLGGTCQTCRI